MILLQKKTKGFENLVIHELSSDQFGFVGFGIPFLDVVEEGRLPLDDKMAFIMTAKKEVIEVGIGLASFSEYFKRRRASEFKDRIGELLSKGIKIKCLLLNPEGEMAEKYAKENEEPEYLDRIRSSLQTLLKIKKEYESLGLLEFHIMIYNSIPRFHATCLDLNTIDGKISLSHYLPNILRSNTPVFRFSHVSNPKLFETYVKSINSLIESAKEVK